MSQSTSSLAAPKAAALAPRTIAVLLLTPAPPLAAALSSCL